VETKFTQLSLILHSDYTFVYKFIEYCALRTNIVGSMLAQCQSTDPNAGQCWFNVNHFFQTLAQRWANASLLDGNNSSAVHIGPHWERYARSSSYKNYCLWK